MSGVAAPVVDPSEIGSSPPAWTTNAVPGFRDHYWAPDLLQVSNRYLLYYSVSTWGSRVSAIVLASSPTLDPAAPAFGWADHGPVVRTSEADNFNAIDPGVTRGTDGRLWMCFGSFWSGIQMVELDPATGLRSAPGSPPTHLAHHASIEAPAIHAHDGSYYLFVNWGLCCRGTNSTYEIRVGRSPTIAGPYLDRHGRTCGQGAAACCWPPRGILSGRAMPASWRRKARRG